MKASYIELSTDAEDVTVVPARNVLTSNFVIGPT